MHTPMPIEYTVAQLMRVLDRQNLVALVSNVFADPSLSSDELLSILVERCQGAPLSFVNSVTEAMFVASEAVYVQAHKHLFDAAVEEAGPSSIFMLTTSTLPTEDLNILQDLATQFPDRPTIQFLNGLVSQFQSREQSGSRRIPRAFLASMSENLRFDAATSLADVANLSTWYQFFNVPAPRIDEFFTSNRWEAAFFESDGESASLFLDALYHRLPDRHASFTTAHKGRLLSQFKLWFDTLAFDEQAGDIRIQFIIDESDETKKANDQAVSRLQHLRRWFPQYEHYQSQGQYPSTGGQSPEIDDSQKNLTGDALDLSLHAPRNAMYGRLVEERYAPRLAFDWAQHWYNLRHKTIEFSRTLVGTYENIYRGRRFSSSQLEPLASELDFLYRQAPHLPARLVSRFGLQQRVIDGWSSSMLAFLQQFLQHNPEDPQNQQSVLMRYNLKDAIKKLLAMHRAFAEIFQAEIDHFNMRTLDSQESMTYPYLADILDYWFEGHRQHVHNLRATLQRWREAKKRSFASRIREGLAPLAKTGMQFLYPSGPLDEHPLTGLCLGYEVLDFERQFEQVGLIGVTIASLDLSYDFLYLVPTVRRHQYGVMATRIGRDTLQRVVSGETVQSGVYPVRPPEGLYAILPDLVPTALPEVALVQRLGEVQGHLTVERNKLYFARSRLDPNNGAEVALLHRYQAEALTRSQELLEMLGLLQAEALSFEDTGAARQEWQSLWEEGIVLVQSLADFSDIDANYTPQPVMQLSMLDPLLARYMNRRYLGL
jgi:hypothetical protein